MAATPISQLKKNLHKQTHKQMRKDQMRAIKSIDEKSDKQLQQFVIGKTTKQVLKETKQQVEKKQEEKSLDVYKRQLHRLGISERDLPLKRLLQEQGLLKKPSTTATTTTMQKELKEDDPFDTYSDLTRIERNACSKIHGALEHVLANENKDSRLNGIQVLHLQVSKDYRHVKVKWGLPMGYLPFDKMQVCDYQLCVIMQLALE